MQAKKMAYKCREEIVGKRFLCVSGLNKTKSNAKIADWGWRSGVIRAASHRDNKNQDLQVNDLFVTLFTTILPDPPPLHCVMLIMQGGVCINYLYLHFSVNECPCSLLIISMFLKNSYSKREDPDYFEKLFGVFFDRSRSVYNLHYHLLIVIHSLPIKW